MSDRVADPAAVLWPGTLAAISIIGREPGSSGRVLAPGALQDRAERGGRGGPCFGLGTGAPVVAFAVLAGLGISRLRRVFRALTRVERWARWSTGVLFTAIGLYVVATRIVGLNL